MVWSFILERDRKFVYYLFAFSLFPPFSYAFSLTFLMLFSRYFPCFPQSFPMFFPRFSMLFPSLFLRFSRYFPLPFPTLFLCISHPFPMLVPHTFPMFFSPYFHAFPAIFPSFSHACFFPSFYHALHRKLHLRFLFTISDDIKTVSLWSYTRSHAIDASFQDVGAEVFVSDDMSMLCRFRSLMFGTNYCQLFQNSPTDCRVLRRMISHC